MSTACRMIEGVKYCPAGPGVVDIFFGVASLAVAGGTIVYGVYKGYHFIRSASQKGMSYVRSVKKMTEETDQFSCAANGYLMGIKAVIRLGRDLDSKHPESGKTALHIACEKGHGSIVNALLAGGASVEILDDQNQTPLLLASRSNNGAIVDSLLGQGVSVKVKDKKGWTPLMHAVMGGSLPVLQSLLQVEDQDLEATNQDGETALHMAAMRKHPEMIKELVDHKASCTAVDGKGRTPAARLLNRVGFETFFDQYFAEKSIESKKNGVLEAYKELSPQLQKNLAEKMAEILKKHEIEAKVELGETLKKPDIRVSGKVKAALQDPYFELEMGPEWRSKKDKLPLMGIALIELKKEGVTDVQLDIKNCLKSLLNPTTLNDAFYHAVANQHTAVVKDFLKRSDVDFDGAGVDGIPPLHAAIRNAGPDFGLALSLMRSDKINKSVRDGQDRSVADVAAECGAIEVLKLCPPDDQAKALLSAMQGRQESCISYLVSQMRREQLEEVKVEDLTLMEYAVVHSPPGLKEMLNKQGIVFQLSDANYQKLESALMRIFHQDLKHLKENTPLNIQEMNELIADLEKGPGPAAKEPSEVFDKLREGIRHYLMQAVIEGNHMEKRTHSKGWELFPISFGEFFRWRSLFTQLFGSFAAEAAARFFSNVEMYPPPGAKEMFSRERSMTELAEMGVPAAKIGIEKLKTEGSSYLKKIEREYSYVADMKF